MSLHDFAQNELDIIYNEIKTDAIGSVIQKDINAQIMAFIDTFAEQGHSGMSATYVILMLERLLRYKPIRPLTGDDDEWDEPDYRGVCQNKRCPSVFKYPNGECYDNDGYAYSDDGVRWYGEKKELDFETITFPYKPPIEPKRYILDETGKYVPYKKED